MLTVWYAHWIMCYYHKKEVLNGTYPYRICHYFWKTPILNKRRSVHFIESHVTRNFFLRLYIEIQNDFISYKLIKLLLSAIYFSLNKDVFAEILYWKDTNCLYYFNVNNAKWEMFPFHSWVEKFRIWIILLLAVKLYCGYPEAFYEKLLISQNTFRCSINDRVWQRFRHLYNFADFWDI